VRLRGAGLLAVGVVVAAWAVGSTALSVLGLGLCLAVALARGWAWLVARSLSVERRPPASTPVEGEGLVLEAQVRGRRLLASRLEWRERIGPLGERSAVVGRGGRARVVVDAVPRGRYPLGPGRLVAGDPLGLRTVELEVPSQTTLLVRPRVAELTTLFTETGAWNDGGRRAQVRRPSGLEPHGVREYVEGEPLRAVHWPTSARRGELMVRELEDAPRDSVAVVLDVDAATHVGAPGGSSLDEAVRAAAAILRAHALRSRRAVLVIGTRAPAVHRVMTLGGDWESALDALAGVQEEPEAPLASLIAARGPAGALPEVVVVTPRPEAVVTALVSRAALGRSSALVAIDTPTYVGRPPAPASPALQRLAGAGVLLAVLRHGEQLAESLGALRMRAVG